MSQPRTRVLVVDDEPRLLRSLKELLELRGYDVTTARGGIAAMDCVEKHQFEVILLDLIMPDVDGHKVLDFLRERRIEIPVIVLSAASSVDAAVRALRRGAEDFLRKPYAPEELLKTLDNVVRKKVLERENQAMQARLAESEKLYRGLVSKSPDVIYMLDESGRFVFVNQTVESLLGYRREELLGEHYSTLVFADDREHAIYAFNERRTGERSSRNVELRLLCKDGQCVRGRFELHAVPVELSAMGLYSEEGREKKRQFLGTYGVARDITERKKAEEIINFQAYHDLLTGLPNRALFKDRLSLAITQATRDGQVFAVMFLDLDRFKMVNDTLGHVIGDELLQCVGGRVKKCLRKGDTLARVGGDEFMLLLPKVRDREGGGQVVQKILSEIRKPFVLGGHELFVTASTGIALFPDDGDKMEALIRNADIAMYAVKARGKDGYEFFSHDMNVPLARRLSLENGMRKALDAGEFVLLYQPQVDIKTGAIKGMEALIRWMHPTRGMLAPMEFIPIAEETGLIVPIGEWVLRTACSEVRHWRRAGLPPVRLAINLSATQMEQGRFVDTVTEALEVNKLPGEALEIEITENAIMRDVEHVVDGLRTLSSQGVRIAIDDFGTGYSSLSYLRILPINTLKIDRSFVSDITAEEEESYLVDAIVAMAKGLRLNLVAEGVETDPQLARLRSLGCAEMQGFIFSPPLPSEAAAALLNKPARDSRPAAT